MCRTILRLAALLLATAATAPATPDHAVDIAETLLGAHETGYAILRTEHDNLSSYYSNRTRQFLDEYAKEGEGHFESAMPRLLRSRLLLDVTNAGDPDEPGKNKTVHTQDNTISLAALLLEYPIAAPPWDPARFQRLTSHQTAGIRLDQSAVCLLHGGYIDSQVFGARLPDNEWKLLDVLQDNNILYLKLTKDSPDEGGTETRLVGIPPRRSRQVLDHLDLQPFYLIAGTFPTLAQAQAHAAALIEKTKGTPGHTYDPEIWSAREATDATHYLVADSQSSDHIEGQRFTSWQTRLGIDLTIRSSAGFVEKWPLLLPGAPAPANAPGPGK